MKSVSLTEVSLISRDIALLKTPGVSEDLELCEPYDEMLARSVLRDLPLLDLYGGASGGLPRDTRLLLSLGL